MWISFLLKESSKRNSVSGETPSSPHAISSPGAEGKRESFDFGSLLPGGFIGEARRESGASSRGGGDV